LGISTLKKYIEDNILDAGGVCPFVICGNVVCIGVKIFCDFLGFTVGVYT